MRMQRASMRIGRDRRFVGDVARLSMAVIAGVVITGTAPAVACDVGGTAPIGSASTQDQTVGVFSGKFVNGIPVYRLPSITVSANRKAELAKIEREGHLTRAKQARARTVARPPA